MSRRQGISVTEAVARPGGGLVRLNAIESAVQWPVGEHATLPSPPQVPDELDPLTALEQAIMPALQRPPCVVAFSGGRDSSAVLAVAVRLARRTGLPLPVPLTQVFPEYEETHEDSWQELVLRHLGVIDSWTRQRVGSELNLLGDIAQRVIRRHGVMSPSTAATVVPWLQAASGGSLLTGVDGDGLFNGGRHTHIRQVLRGHVPPRPRDALKLVKHASPYWIQRRWMLRKPVVDLRWLRPAAADWLAQAATDEAVSEPLRWDRRVPWHARRRLVVAQQQWFHVLANDEDVLVVQPFLDPIFIASLAQAGGSLGFGDRTAAMRTLFGELLPDALLSRQTKADFTAPVWEGEAREFRTQWDGTGVNVDIVDPDALRHVWMRQEPDARTGVLLHAAWARSSGIAECRQPLNCIV